MKTLKEQAQAYEPQQTTKNIVELNRVPVDVEITVEEHKNKKDELFSVNVITVEGEKYRVPTSVIAQLKIHLEGNPQLLYFKVMKTGADMNTQYTVIPLGNEVL